MSSNMDTVTNVQTCEILAKNQWISVFPKHFNNEWSQSPEALPDVLEKTNNYALSCGTSDRDLQSITKTIDNIRQRHGCDVKMVCVDIANGYLDSLVQSCAQLRHLLPNIVLMAGNVVTPEGLYELVHKGTVDVVKVGIGSGAACTTRLKTGVGYP